MRRAMAAVLLVCTAAGAGASTSLRGGSRDIVRAHGLSAPNLTYAFSSFSTYDPEAASSFCMKYLNATLLSEADFLTHKMVP